MKETLISFQVAKLAKEKGFKEKCASAYIYRNISHEMPKYEGIIIHKGILLCDIYAPTQALLSKWLRELHCIDVIVIISVSDKKYYKCIINESEPLRRPNQYFVQYDFRTINIYNTYEEALEAGLQEALKLI